MEKITVLRAIYFTFIFAAAVYFTGCQTMQSAYNKTREVFGVQKRDIMVGAVKEARSSLEEVKARFQSAMEKFNTVLSSSEMKLEEKHKLLKSENEKTEKKAGDIQKNIDSVIKVSESMFTEWEAELNLYTSENLRSSSEQRMQEAKNQDTKFINAMTLANEKAGPVITALGDLVLFSKHNLNSGSAEFLKTEMDSIGEKVATLIQEIDASIAEADALIRMMAGGETAQ